MLEHLLWQQNNTYDEVAAEFTRLAESLGERATISPRHMRRLAAGERASCTPVTRRVMSAMFGRSLDELIRPWSEASELASIKAGQLVISTPQTAQEEILKMATNRARQFGLMTGQVTLSGETLEQLYDDTRYLCGAYPQQPLANVLGDIASTQETIFSLLETRQRPSDSQQLYFLAGIVSGLLAKASHDMGDPHSALTQARTAFLCADHAEHNGLRAWIRGLQALVTYWDNRYLDSVRYAQQGREFASGSASATNVWLPVSEARAWAALGNPNEARRAIDQAEAAWSQVGQDDLDNVGGVCTFSRARQLYYSADALAWLPSEADAAADYSAQAIEAYSDPTRPEWAFGDEAGSHADLAVARIAQGELDGAVEAIAPVLVLPAEKRIKGIIASTKHVQSALVRAGESRAARNLQEQIEVFNRTPISSLPR
jgi:tetratricopeptide (TPR) repeat protein